MKRLSGNQQEGGGGGGHNIPLLPKIENSMRESYSKRVVTQSYSKRV